VLGWEARIDPREGIAQTVDWLRGLEGVEPASRPLVH